MLILDEMVDDILIEIIIDDPWKECWMNISYTKFNISKDYSYPNAIKLSADLVNIGYTNAVKLLEKNNVPRTHPIWHLNHSDLWQPNK